MGKRNGTMSQKDLDKVLIVRYFDPTFLPVLQPVVIIWREESTHE